MRKKVKLAEANRLEAELDVQRALSKLAAAGKAEKALTDDKAKLETEKQQLGHCISLILRVG